MLFNDVFAGAKLGLSEIAGLLSDSGFRRVEENVRKIKNVVTACGELSDRDAISSL